MSAEIEQIRAALSDVVDPNTRRTLGALAGQCEVAVRGDLTDITVPLGYPLHTGREEFTKRIVAALEGLGRSPGNIRYEARVATHLVPAGMAPLPGVRNIIAGASGKGGVGKSTTSVNVALALQAAGARVGLVDADIYGPSVPLMLGLSGRPEIIDGKQMAPLVGHGLQANSIGFLIDDGSPAIWRGPMVTQALMQLLTQTAWQDLDYLFVDMPPGTGDIALTLSQKVPLTGAVIVTTPQDLALIDALKGLKMFQKVKVPVLGVIENMSVHVCSNCGHAEPIFGEHGGRQMAQAEQVPWLGELPLEMNIRRQTDAGRPTVVSDPDSAAAGRYRDIAQRLAVNLAGLPALPPGPRPTVVARQT